MILTGVPSGGTPSAIIKSMIIIITVTIIAFYSVHVQYQLHLLGYITPSSIPGRNLNDIEPFFCSFTKATFRLINL